MVKKNIRRGDVNSRNTTQRRYTEKQRNASRHKEDEKDIYRARRGEDIKERQSTRRSGRGGCLGLIVIIIVVICAIGLYIFRGPIFGIIKEEKTPTSTEVSEATAQVVATPSAEIAATSTPTASPEPIRPIGYINTEDEDGTVRVREASNRNAYVLGKMTNREVLYILAKENGYYKTRYAGRIGFVLCEYVIEGLPEDDMLCDVITKEIVYSKLVDIEELIPDLRIEMPLHIWILPLYILLD